MSSEGGSDKRDEPGAGLVHLSSKIKTSSDRGASVTASSTTHSGSDAEKETREARRRRKKKSRGQDDGSQEHSSKNSGSTRGKKKKKPRRPTEEVEFDVDMDIDEEQARTFDVSGVSMDIGEEQARTFDVGMDIDEEQAVVHPIDTEYDTEHSEEAARPEEYDTEHSEEAARPEEYDTEHSEEVARAAQPEEYDTEHSEEAAQPEEYDTEPSVEAAQREVVPLPPLPPSPSPPYRRVRGGVSSVIGQQASSSATSASEELSVNLQLMIFFRQALFRFSTLFSIIIYSIITFIVLEVGSVKTSIAYERLNASKATVAFFSSFLGFSLVFRTNICYNRWWEGRCLWGALIFSAVNLAHQGKFCIQSKERYRRLCSLVVCFAYACKGQLSASSMEADAEHLLVKGIITPMELDYVTSRNGWQPYYFLTALRDTIQGDVAARPEGNLFSFQSDLVTMDGTLNTLATSIGGLIRVKATGLPIAYDWLFNVIFIIFFTVATLAWAPTLGWYTPILISVLNFVVHLIIGIGSALEDPFGDDITDLPMGKFCEAIAAQVEAIYHDEIPILVGGGWPRSGRSKGRDSLGQVILHRIGRVRNRRSTASRITPNRITPSRSNTSRSNTSRSTASRSTASRSTAASAAGMQEKVTPAPERGRGRASASLAMFDIRPKET